MSVPMRYSLDALANAVRGFCTMASLAFAGGQRRIGQRCVKNAASLIKFIADHKAGRRRKLPLRLAGVFNEGTPGDDDDEDDEPRDPAGS